jgi:hypothetical protein
MCQSVYNKIGESVFLCIYVELIPSNHNATVSNKTLADVVDRKARVAGPQSG